MEKKIMGHMAIIHIMTPKLNGFTAPWLGRQYAIEMDKEVIASPISETFEAQLAFSGYPDITDIHYDLGILRITLDFKGANHPVCATFDTPRGFRMLDEGDLLEFWNNETRPKGWLWVVKSGGWYDLEKYRSGFVSGVTRGYSEYLVLGENECVNVITCDEPFLYERKP